jgi:hypothetical protein
VNSCYFPSLCSLFSRLDEDDEELDMDGLGQPGTDSKKRRRKTPLPRKCVVVRCRVVCASFVRLCAVVGCCGLFCSLSRVVVRCCTGVRCLFSLFVVVPWQWWEGF